LILALRCRQLLELQLHLIDQPLAAFRARTELLTLHLLDHQLKMLDQRGRAHELGARLKQRRFERIHVVGKLICCSHHASTESQTS
jgi:hypothetical protein